MGSAQRAKSGRTPRTYSVAKWTVLVVLGFFKQKTPYEVQVWVEFRRVVFFFQAEDGIRDSSVTGVQTCALPISSVITLNSRKFATHPMWQSRHRSGRRICGNSA